MTESSTQSMRRQQLAKLRAYLPVSPGDLNDYAIEPDAAGQPLPAIAVLLADSPSRCRIRYYGIRFYANLNEALEALEAELNDENGLTVWRPVAVVALDDGHCERIDQVVSVCNVPSSLKDVAEREGIQPAERIEALEDLAANSDDPLEAAQLLARAEALRGAIVADGYEL